MITLFPITTWSGPSRGGPAGTNWPFYATADRTHIHAAAIMAQEIYESRYKTVRLVATVAGLTLVTLAVSILGLGYSLSTMDVVVVLMVSTIIGILVMAFSPWKQTLELRGHMVETIVRGTAYGHDFETASAESLAFLKRYDQFNGWSPEQLRSRFLQQRDHCADWLRTNRKMIGRISEDLAA